MGIPVDPATGNLTGSVPQVLQFAQRLPAGAADLPGRLSRQPRRAIRAPQSSDSSRSRVRTAAARRTSPMVNPRSVQGTPAAALYRREHHRRHAARTTRRRRRARSRGATTLSGAATGTNSLSTNFAAGDTITVNGTTISFRSGVGGSAGNQRRTSPIGPRRQPPSAICSPPSTASPVRLRPTSLPLTAAARSPCTRAPPSNPRHHQLATPPRSPRSASPAPVTALRAGGGTAGTGQVTGTDVQTFLRSSRSRRCGDRLRHFRLAGEPAIPLGQDRLRFARRRPHRYAGTCSTRSTRNATGTDVAWQNVNTEFHLPRRTAR